MPPSTCEACDFHANMHCDSACRRSSLGVMKQGCNKSKRHIQKGKEGSHENISTVEKHQNRSDSAEKLNSKWYIPKRLMNILKPESISYSTLHRSRALAHSLTSPMVPQGGASPPLQYLQIEQFTHPLEVLLAFKLFCELPQVPHRKIPYIG